MITIAYDHGGAVVGVTIHETLYAPAALAALAKDVEVLRRERDAAVAQLARVRAVYTVLEEQYSRADAVGRRGYYWQQTWDALRPTTTTPALPDEAAQVERAALRAVADAAAELRTANERRDARLTWDNALRALYAALDVLAALSQEQTADHCMRHRAERIEAALRELVDLKQLKDGRVTDLGGVTVGTDAYWARKAAAWVAAAAALAE